MKELRIVSPSKNRIDFTIGKVLGEDIDIVIEPQDQKQYDKATDHPLIIMKENDMGFGYVLAFIVKHYLKLGYKYVLFADDDIYGLKSRDNKRVEDVQVFIKEGVAHMKKHDYAQLMVSFCGHNWYTKEQFKEDVGCWGMIFIDLEKTLAVGNYDTELRIFNDWDMSARLIRAGHKVACWYDYQFEHKMKSKKGGAHDLYKDNAFMKEQCKVMERKYGSAVRTMYHEGHQQFEIRFDWKKLRNRGSVGISSFFKK